MKISIYFYILSILMVLLHSCTSTEKVPERSSFHRIENVPFYPQETYQCGPASLAGVLNYWKMNVSPEEISAEIFSQSARGTLNIDMVLYAQKKGLNAALYEGGLQDLEKNIDSGYPVIVLVDYGFSLYQANHFMVVIGYNEKGVLVNSGKEQNKFIDEKNFMKSWQRTNYLTILIKK